MASFYYIAAGLIPQDATYAKESGSHYYIAAGLVPDDLPASSSSSSISSASSRSSSSNSSTSSSSDSSYSRDEIADPDNGIVCGVGAGVGFPLHS